MEWWMWVIGYFIAGFAITLIVSWWLGKSRMPLPTEETIVLFVAWPIVLVLWQVVNFSQFVNNKAKESK